MGGRVAVGVVVMLTAPALSAGRQAPAAAVEARDRDIARLEARVSSGSADCSVYRDLGKRYQERGDFDLGLTTVRLCTSAAPAEPAAYVAVAEYLSTRAFTDVKLHPDERRRLIDEGIRETDQALAIDADYLPAVTFKHMFVQRKASIETDPVTHRALISEADGLRRRANGLARKQRDAQLKERAVAAGLPPDSQPVRVGGNIKPPTKTRHVDPVYPEAARAARAQGVVVLEATIGGDGRVVDARILRSIPILDQAAVDAVLQWEFEPTRVNGEPVPVIITLTVNFSLR